MVLGISRRFTGLPFLMLRECNAFLWNVETCVSKDSITFQEAFTFNSNALSSLIFSSETWLDKVTCLKVLKRHNYVPYFLSGFRVHFLLHIIWWFMQSLLCLCMCVCVHFNFWTPYLYINVIHSLHLSNVIHKNKVMSTNYRTRNLRLCDYFAIVYSAQHILFIK